MERICGWGRCSHAESDDDPLDSQNFSDGQELSSLVSQDQVQPVLDRCASVVAPMSALILKSDPGDYPRNRLLRVLPLGDRRRILGLLEPVTLKPRQILHHWGIPMQHVYFVEHGLISVCARGNGDEAFEVWLIGSEGMTGVPVVLGGHFAPPHRRVVQIGGSAMKIAASKLRQLTDELPALREILLRYVQVVLLQASQGGLCSAHHSVQERLSRWLLTASDGLESIALPLTHQVVAKLLGVRRSTVTDGLRALEKSGAIEYTRGLIRIVDSHKLLGSSCNCYGVVERELRLLLEQTNTAVQIVRRNSSREVNS